MNLSPLVKAKRLRPHATSLEELGAIRALIQRDLHDADIEALSPDRRFATAYDGALQLCRLVLACAGYRVPFIVNYHDTTFEATELVLGEAASDLRAYFGACRKKRSVVDYDAAEVVTHCETLELVKKTRDLKDLAESWIAAKHAVFKS